MCTNTVVVIDAALSACSSPGIRSLSVVIASAMVCGLAAMMAHISAAYRRRLSVMVVGAGACSVLSSGTGLSLFGCESVPLFISDHQEMWEVRYDVYSLGPCRFVYSPLQAPSSSL